MNRILVLLCVFLSACNYGTQKEPSSLVSLNSISVVDASDVEAIKASMAISERMWNNCDFTGFMHNYWKSEELKFVGKTGINYGWNTTLNRYLAAYPDKDSSGTLTFTLESFEYIGSKDAMLVVGKYLLKRNMGNASGYFSLIWKRIDGVWTIVVDHSS